MNKHILFEMQNLKDPTYYTKEQREENSKSASEAYLSASTATTAGAYAAATAAYYAYYAAYYGANSDAYAEYWINKYFSHTGENKQDYIDALPAIKKQPIKINNELKEISIGAMKSILSSKHINSFVNDGRKDNFDIDMYEAVAIEAERYAVALITQLNKG